MECFVFEKLIEVWTCMMKRSVNVIREAAAEMCSKTIDVEQVFS